MINFNNWRGADKDQLKKINPDEKAFNYVKDADKEIDLSGDIIGSHARDFLKDKKRISSLIDRTLKIKDITDYEDRDGNLQRYLTVDEIFEDGDMEELIYYISPNSTDTLGVPRNYKKGYVINAQTMFNTIYFNQGELGPKARRSIRKAIW